MKDQERLSNDEWLWEREFLLQDWVPTPPPDLPRTSGDWALFAIGAVVMASATVFIGAAWVGWTLFEKVTS